MIAHDVQPGSREWIGLRLGIPTASLFHKIIQPEKLKTSRSRKTYLHELLVERRLGRPHDESSSEWMGRAGRQLAPGNSPDGCLYLAASLSAIRSQRAVLVHLL